MNGCFRDPTPRSIMGAYRIHIHAIALSCVDAASNRPDSTDCVTPTVRSSSKMGSTLRRVQTLMGHSRPSTTLNVYAHLLQEPNREAAQSIQARIDKVKARRAMPNDSASDNRSNAAD